MNPLETAIELGGGLSVFAEKIAAKPNQVNNWRSRGVPIEFCALIEIAVGGKVTRQDLRPNDWQKIWPELAAGDNALSAQHSSLRLQSSERTLV
jgi:DNA-binding transcriptional regulator YdaS (Cro superfamily)